MKLFVLPRQEICFSVAFSLPEFIDRLEENTGKKFISLAENFSKHETATYSCLINKDKFLLKRRIGIYNLNVFYPVISGQLFMEQAENIRISLVCRYTTFQKVVFSVVSVLYVFLIPLVLYFRMIKPFLMLNHIALSLSAFFINLGLTFGAKKLLEVHLKGELSAAVNFFQSLNDGNRSRLQKNEDF